MVSANIILALMCVAVTSVLAAESGLPKHLVPESYAINLTFPASIFKGGNKTAFTGHVLIKLKVLQATEEIKFYASKNFIVINSISVDDDELTTTVDPLTSIVTAKKNGVKYSKGRNLLLNITYTGKISLNDELGIFRSAHVKSSLKIGYSLKTQFQPSGARRAFPSFDEPSFKSYFDVSVTYPKGYKAVFNTPKYLSITAAKGEIKEYFKRTPKISTSQLSLAISEPVSTHVERQ